MAAGDVLVRVPVATTGTRRAAGRKDIVFPRFHTAQRHLYDNRTIFDVWRCGRRFGKTTALEVIAGDEALKGKKIGWFAPNYKLLAPTYKRILRTIRPRVEHSSKVDSLIEVKGGGEIEFWTLNDEDAGRSRFYDLAIIDEGSLVKRGLREIWEQSIAPTLLDRGGRAIMAGTPKGIDPENFFYQACTDPLLGFSPQHMPSSANPKLDPARLAELPDRYPALVYQQEYLAEFVDWNGAALFGLDKLLQDGQGVAYPDKCDYVFATIDTAIKDGKTHDSTAVTFWARNQFYGIPLIVLDWDIIQIEGDNLEFWLPGIFAQLDELAARCGARRGSAGAFIEDKGSGITLLQRARKKGWPATAIEGDLTAMGKDERAISVAGYVHQNMAKLSQHAHDKRKRHKAQDLNHFETQVCGFRMGDKDAAKRADDLLDTFTYGLALALGDSDGL